MNESAKLAGIRRLVNEPLSRYTFTKTGGPADELAFPTSVAELAALAADAQERGLPLTVIGNASNLIVKDGGIRGVTVILTAMNKPTVSGQTLTVEAGERLIDTTEFAYRAGLSGLEFAAGIPGSVGGAVFMNAGAYGGEIADVLAEATVMMPDGTVRTFTHAEMAFSYRHSLVQDNGGIVLSVTFALKAADPITIRTRMDDVNLRRATKQPLEYPSCGSVFKRPVGHFVGPMIQEAGLSGHVIGGAQVSTKHAGFIVNVNHATASDYLAMIAFIQEKVQAQFGVRLEPEVRIIGVD